MQGVGLKSSRLANAISTWQLVLLAWSEAHRGIITSLNEHWVFRADFELYAVLAMCAVTLGGVVPQAMH
jgi:hypothetical protein